MVAILAILGFRSRGRRKWYENRGNLVQGIQELNPWDIPNLSLAVLVALTYGVCRIGVVEGHLIRVIIACFSC